MNPESHPRSPRPFRAWINYFTHIMHPASAAAPDQVSQPLTKRQQLLQAQELKQRAQREHLLELLREVKERHRPSV